MDDNRKKRAVTQDDVAKRAGVSRSIVSYVLNGGPRPVAPDTKERILKAIEELGYRPNKFARNLMKSQYDAVADKQFGIVMSGVFMLRRPYYADILAGIHSTAHQNNHHIRFLRFFQDLKDPVLFNELIHKEEISGLILISLDQSLQSEEDRKLIEEIKRRIDNIVCVEWEFPGLPSVSFNRQEAAYKGCRYLLERGYEKIAYIGPHDNRVLGFQQALLEAKKLPLENPMLYIGSDLEDGAEGCRKMMDKHSDLQAILGGTDEVSIGVLHQLNKSGMPVPEKMALVSIDNIEVSQYTHPPLTTVNVDTVGMGTTAVQILINRATMPDQSETHTLLPTELVIRESCG